MHTRKSDITFIIRQDNEKKDIIVESAHEPAVPLSAIIGYSADEVKGRSIKTIVSEDVNNAIKEYVEFTDFGNDVSSVFKKIQKFLLISKDGKEVEVSVRINRTASPDKHARFIMVMRDKSRIAGGLVQVLEDLRAHEVLDDETGLCTWESFLKKVEIIHNYLGKADTKATFSIIGIDKFREFVGIYGDVAGNKLIKAAANFCRRSFREADVLGLVGKGRFGVVLLEADLETALIPLNRLRGQIANQPLYVSDKSSTNITLSIAYKEIAKGEKIENTIEVCKKVLNDNLGSNNQILKV